MDALAVLVQAIMDFFGLIIQTYGPNKALAIFFGIVVFFVLARIYFDYKKSKEVALAIKLMEQAVQRASNDARDWRIFFLKEKGGWSDDEIERFVMGTQFDDPAS